MGEILNGRTLDWWIHTIVTALGSGGLATILVLYFVGLLPGTASPFKEHQNGPGED